jgi:hypothetical protein
VSYCAISEKAAKDKCHCSLSQRSMVNIAQVFNFITTNFSCHRNDIFNDPNFRTVHSVINRSPPSLMLEILLIDDASDHSE